MKGNESLVDVGSINDFAEGCAQILMIDELEIGVIRWRAEEIYALRNVCPHMGGPVCAGRMSALLRPGSTPGELISDNDTPVIACSWHRWEFDVRTGRSIQPSRYRVQTYPVTVSNTRVIIDLSRGRADRRTAATV